MLMLIIVIIMLVVQALTGVLAYKIGHNKGYWRGWNTYRSQAIRDVFRNQAEVANENL